MMQYFFKEFVSAQVYLIFGKLIIHLSHVCGKQSKKTSLTSINFMLYIERKKIGRSLLGLHSVVVT